MTCIDARRFCVVGNQSIPHDFVIPKGRFQMAPSSPKIIIVEDDPIVALGLESLLTCHGYTIAGIAEDLEEALKIVRSGDVDIAIIDIHLARGPDGVCVAEVLRQQHDIPALFVSGGIEPDDEVRALRSRPIGFIDKPFAETWLLGALRAADAMRKRGVAI
ncbi:response regulator [Aurantimonas sp. VKM B-3413]|uniref:response regulator n=1 Tax=Aurantimonas sp. VKM B-3413 TaxID=2779401 RepID=UPI001E3BCF3D|nr:response regulator [Aurantimonas sp. VKM B-3413]MCB8839840.1 response regulator [Aurantimonas sp. VKM B-3413]